MVLDVDSTLIQDEVIELLAEEAGCDDEVRAITQPAMAGELDFDEALRASGCACWTASTSRRSSGPGSGCDSPPGPGPSSARSSASGTRSGSSRAASPTSPTTSRTELELDHAVANELEIRDGRLTGEVVGAVVDRARKAELLAEFAAAEGIPLSQTVAVGDGANDLDMLAAAGLGMAFNAKPVVQEAADTTVNVPYLDAVLFVLGVTRDEVERRTPRLETLGDRAQAASDRRALDHRDQPVEVAVTHDEHAIGDPAARADVELIERHGLDALQVLRHGHHRDRASSRRPRDGCMRATGLSRPITTPPHRPLGPGEGLAVDAVLGETGRDVLDQHQQLEQPADAGVAQCTLSAPASTC